MSVQSFYHFALHTVSYLVTNQSGRYFHTVRAGQTSFARSNFQTSESYRKDRMPFLQPKLRAVWKFFGFRTVWLLQVRISILLRPLAGGMLQTSCKMMESSHSMTNDHADEVGLSHIFQMVLLNFVLLHQVEHLSLHSLKVCWVTTR